jgi:hypothetical protein
VLAGDTGWKQGFPLADQLWRRVREIGDHELIGDDKVLSMKAQGVTPRELLPGFVAAERGGVVLLAELQSQGYAYIRP